MGTRDDTQSQEQRLGGYRILREIGRGAMGIVYKAHEESLNRVVALKVLRAGLVDEEAPRKRFRREAQAMAALNHPNVVQVYAVGEADGHHYIAMEYVKGTSLDRLLKEEGYLEPGRAVGIVLQAAQALSSAHKKGILHRDLKPSNILLEDELERVKVADFGLAKVLAAATMNLTAESAALGTPRYMSPEQARGEEVDRQTDVYSLGVVLYELLSGSLPHKADSPLTVMKMVAHEPPRPLTTEDGRIPEALCNAVNRAIEPDRRKRFQAMDEFIEALAPFGLPQPAVPVRLPSRKGRWLRGVAFGGGVCLAIALVALAARRHEAIPEAGRGAPTAKEGPHAPAAPAGRGGTGAAGVEKAPLPSPEAVPPERPGPPQDDFEDGWINGALWVIGGARRGWGPAAKPFDDLYWEHSVKQVAGTDGCLAMRVWGPQSSYTAGAEAWVRTAYDFHDGKDYIVDFTWDSVVESGHNYDKHFIQVTDGYVSPVNSLDWQFSPSPPAGTTDLLWERLGDGSMEAGRKLTSGLPKSTWSIRIGHEGIARLYEGPGGTGTMLHEAPLDASKPWHIRFMVSDGTSQGLPAGDVTLRLYALKAKVLESTGQ